MKSLICVICVFIISISMLYGQLDIRDKNAAQRKNGSEKTNNRWKPTLDLLIQETGTLSPKEKRPNAMAEVADAYWNLDSQFARTLFTEATDVALSLEKKKDRAKSFRYVLHLAAKRDSNLAKNLIEKAEKSESLKGEIEDASIETINEILDEDVLKSAELLEKIAPSGLKHGNAMFLIFQIAKKNPELADRIYQIYLNKVLADEKFPLEISAYLIGYAFGYSDYYSLNADGSDSIGANLVLPQSLVVNRTQANSLLSYLFRRINRDLQNPELTNENLFKKMTALFVIDYLIDDAALLAPTTFTNWEQLRQRAAAGLTSIQTEQISKSIRQIKERRAAIKRAAENSSDAAVEKEVSADEIAKLADVCQRDRLYMKNAIAALAVENYEKAIRWTDKVEDLQREQAIKTYIHFDFAAHLADKKEWDEIPKHIKEISDNRLKTLLLVQLARKALEQKQTQTALGWLSDSYKMSEKLENLEERKSLFFELASIHPGNFEARNFFDEAIKLVNRSSEQDSKNFSFLIKVPLSCNDDSEWFGGNVSLQNGELLSSLNVLAKKDAETFLPGIQNLDNSPIRVKAVSLLIKRALESEKQEKISSK